MSSLRPVSLLRAGSLATALSLLACSADNGSSPLAPTASRQSARIALPFTGTRGTVQTSFTPLGPTTVLLRAEGTGTSTHLGRYTEVSDLTLDLATLTGVEHVSLTAANRDMLFVTAEVQATPNADGVTVTVVESATITGGTGRFAGATGSYTIRCVANQATGISTGSFAGTIVVDR
jgi:hypothetical protein